MSSKQFNELVEKYGEGNLLRDVYGEGFLIELSTEEAIRALEEDKFYIDDVVRRLGKGSPDGYTREELKEDAYKYREGLMEYLRYLGTTGYSEDEVQEIISLIHKRYGELILFNKDLLKVIEYEAKNGKYEDRKQLALFTKFSNITGKDEQGIGDKIKENATRLLRENESFKSVVNTGTIQTYEDFMDDIEGEIDLNYKKYTEDSIQLIPDMYDKEVYLRYLDILEERVYTKGKEDSIKELSSMYPEKFKYVGEYWAVDLGNYYMTWMDSVRIISKGLTAESLPKQEWEIESGSKEMIMKWFEYNNLYGIFQ